MRALEISLAEPGHVFWPLEHGIHELQPEIRERLAGHRQLTDALLLELAIRNGGRLATFDRRIEDLLAPDSSHRDALDVLPAG